MVVDMILPEMIIENEMRSYGTSPSQKASASSPDLGTDERLEPGRDRWAVASAHCIPRNQSFRVSYAAVLTKIPSWR